MIPIHDNVHIHNVCVYIHFKFYTVEYVINYLINGCNIKIGCGRDRHVDIIQYQKTSDMIILGTLVSCKLHEEVGTYLVRVAISNHMEMWYNSHLISLLLHLHSSLWQEETEPELSRNRKGTNT